MVVSARRCGDRSRGIRSVLVGISRRVVIITSGLVGVGAGVGGWALLAENRLAPGRSLIDQAMGRCDIPTPLLDAKPGRLVEGSFFSAHRRKTVSYTLAYPPKAVPGARLPVCLVLHGYGVDHDAAFDDIGYHRLLAAVVGARTPPFVLASVDGGDGYWHPHAAGAASADDPLGMLTKDFPVVLSPARVVGEPFCHARLVHGRFWCFAGGYRDATAVRCRGGERAGVLALIRRSAFRERGGVRLGRRVAGMG